MSNKSQRGLFLTTYDWRRGNEANAARLDLEGTKHGAKTVHFVVCHVLYDVLCVLCACF